MTPHPMQYSRPPSVLLTSCFLKLGQSAALWNSEEMSDRYPSKP